MTTLHTAEEILARTAEEHIADAADLQAAINRGERTDMSLPEVGVRLLWALSAHIRDDIEKAAEFANSRTGA